MNIYIANISTQLKAEELITMFTPYGIVASAEIAMDGFTGKSRGFGYVNMPDEEQAQSAIAALHHSEVEGKKLSVQKSAPKTEHKGSYKIGNGAVNVYRFRKN